MRLALSTIATLALAGSVYAGTATMTFEGIGNLGDPTFSYANGAQNTTYGGPAFSPVINPFGVIIFNGNTLIATSAGGTGNQAYPMGGPPSPSTALNNNGNPLIFDTDLPGAITDISFWYSAINQPVTLNFFSTQGADLGPGFGNPGGAVLIGTEVLPVTPANDGTQGCVGGQPFCPWTFVDINPMTMFALPNGTVSFSFGTNTPNQLVVDDVSITWNEPPPPTGAPEPATMALFVGGAALIGISRKYLPKRG